MKDFHFLLISDKEFYTIEDNILKPISENPEDIFWVVDELANASLKYSIYINRYLSIGETTFFDYPIAPKNASIYLAMPLFQISHTAEFLDQEDILNNINIKDATRIGIFNRQLYLYGPKTKSNSYSSVCLKNNGICHSLIIILKSQNQLCMCIHT